MPFLSLLLPTVVPAAAAATLYVGPTDTYTTITAALTAAASGDTIILRAGTYAENLDLRSKSVTIVGERGPKHTTIAVPSTLWVRGTTTIRGVSFDPAPAYGLFIDSGTVTIDDVEVHHAPANGVTVNGGTVSITETAVFDAAQSSFVFAAGTTTVVRSLSWNPGQDGFVAQVASTIRNSLAIGGSAGFRTQNASSTLENLAALGTSGAALNVYTNTTARNVVFRDVGYVGGCNSGAVPTFDHGVAWLNYVDSGCSTPTQPHTTLTNADPLFVAWSTRLDLPFIDLTPAAGSPIVNAGTGTADTDGSTADLGIFGGPYGRWTDNDADGQVRIFDCDDFDATTHVGAVERADGIDNDCDGAIDEDVPADTGVIDTGDSGTDTAGTDTGETGGDSGATAVDVDGDGYAGSADCDEHNIATHRGAAERPDRADNDCDGVIDEGTTYGDDDGDGYSESMGDCDDTAADRYPGAPDDVYNALDNDCDGQEDAAHGVDADGDGYRDDAGDCDDTNPAVHPNAADGVDSVDSNCDGVVDGDVNNLDADNDGVTPRAGDCDDHDAAVHAGAVDVADNFVDEDCSGSDNYDIDRDGDPSPAAGGTDCDDNDSTSAPSKTERCDDGRDNDCDGTVDEDCAPVDSGSPSEEGGCACASGGAAPGPELALALGLVGVALRRRRGGVPHGS